MNDVTPLPCACVYLLEYLDYPESGGGVETDGAWLDEAAAMSALKTRFGAPYRVEWSEIRDDIGLIVIGNFERVLDYSTEHTGKWAVVKVPVNG